MGRPEEIAALFLASSAASFVNGIELFVDGAWARFNSQHGHLRHGVVVPDAPLTAAVETMLMQLLPWAKSMRSVPETKALAAA